MSNFGLLTKRFARDEVCAANIEYAILLGFIALLVILSAFAVGQLVHGMYGDVQEDVETMGEQ